ncbi:YugN family protein [Bhargavaea ullalensis]|uniref:YugN-like family protein n=1 Tax=Bhargavaea ullalensis TaxID=1265685 RepID=A0ABV2G7Z9_9BACL
MLKLQTELEGRMASFGNASECVRGLGYHMGGSWDYDQGCFDRILYQEGGETIYLRLPFAVMDGQLDHFNAGIRFGTPYVIKHVVHVGLDRDGGSLLDATGFSQFQEPIDRDGHIENKNKWVHAGEEAIEKLMDCLNEQGLLRTG